MNQSVINAHRDKVGFFNKLSLLKKDPISLCVLSFFYKDLHKQWGTEHQIGLVETCCVQLTEVRISSVKYFKHASFV